MFKLTFDLNEFTARFRADAQIFFGDAPYTDDQVSLILRAYILGRARQLTGEGRHNEYDVMREGLAFLFAEGWRPGPEWRWW